MVCKTFCATRRDAVIMVYVLRVHIPGIHGAKIRTNDCQTSSQHTRWMAFAVQRFLYYAHQVAQQTLGVYQELGVGEVEPEVLVHVLHVGLETGADVVVEQAAPHVPGLPSLCRSSRGSV